MKLRSRYTVGEIPHSEHPCPQRMRKDWVCLNGAWDFYKQTAVGKRENESTILVPRELIKWFERRFLPEKR